MLGLKPTFAKDCEGDEGVPSTSGQPQIFLDWGGCLGQTLLGSLWGRNCTYG